MALTNSTDLRVLFGASDRTVTNSADLRLFVKASEDGTPLDPVDVQEMMEFFGAFPGYLAPEP